MILFQILIVVAAVFLFSITVILNRKTKIKGDSEDLESSLPDTCLTCSNKTCLEGLKKYKNDRDKIRLTDECHKGGQNNEE